MYVFYSLDTIILFTWYYIELLRLCSYNHTTSQRTEISVSLNLTMLIPFLITSQTKRTEWVLEWPGQVVIAGCQTFWSTEVSDSLEEGKLPERLDILIEQVL